MWGCVCVKEGGEGYCEKVCVYETVLDLTLCFSGSQKRLMIWCVIVFNRLGNVGKKSLKTLSLLLILLLLNLTVRNMNTFVSPCRRRQKTTAHCVLSNEMDPGEAQRNNTVLSSCSALLPLILHPLTCKAAEVDTHPLFLFILIVILRPPANPFLSPFRPPLSCVSVFSLAHVHDRNHQTARKGGGNM